MPLYILVEDRVWSRSLPKRDRLRNTAPWSANFLGGSGLASIFLHIVAEINVYSYQSYVRKHLKSRPNSGDGGGGGELVIENESLPLVKL